MTYAEKRAEVIASARAGDLSPLNAFVDQLRHVGMPKLGCEDWFYEIDHLSSRGKL